RRADRRTAVPAVPPGPARLPGLSRGAGRLDRIGVAHRLVAGSPAGCSLPPGDDDPLAAERTEPRAAALLQFRGESRGPRLPAARRHHPAVEPTGEPGLVRSPTGTLVPLGGLPACPDPSPGDDTPLDSGGQCAQGAPIPRDQWADCPAVPLPGRVGDLL